MPAGFRLVKLLEMFVTLICLWKGMLLRCHVPRRPVTGRRGERGHISTKLHSSSGIIVESVLRSKAELFPSTPLPCIVYMRGSNASQKMSVAKHDRHVDADVDENMTSCKKWRKPSSSVAVGGCRKQSCRTNSSALWRRLNIDMVWSHIARRQWLARSARY